MALGQSPSSENIDKTYDPYIKTVQLYPNLNKTGSQLLPPIVPLIQSPVLLLTFDELGSEARIYNAKIVRCEADWTESSLPPMEYLSVYNDFLIRDYQFSINTKIPFVHYEFTVPKVKLSGNYLIKVFFEDEENLILTKRFMVFEEKASIGFEQTIPIGGEDALRKQQFNMQVNYSGIRGVVNPNQQFNVVVMQNYRWDNAKYNLSPTFVKDHQNTLDYSSLGDRQAFDGSNEFRMFDFRNPQRFGWRIDSVKFRNNGDVIFLEKEISREKMSYGARFEDLNGQYYIETQARPEYSSTEADYVYVNFVLDLPKQNQPVYIFGELSEWRLQPDFRMNYVASEGFYAREVLLKQGVYNYFYVLEDRNGIDDFALENSYRQTENDYDILVYYRPMGGRTDFLVGYRKIED